MCVLERMGGGRGEGSETKRDDYNHDTEYPHCMKKPNMHVSDVYVHATQDDHDKHIPKLVFWQASHKILINTLNLHTLFPLLNNSKNKNTSILYIAIACMQTCSSLSA